MKATFLNKRVEALVALGATFLIALGTLLILPYSSASAAPTPITWHCVGRVVAGGTLDDSDKTKCENTGLNSGESGAVTAGTWTYSGEVAGDDTKGANGLSGDVTINAEVQDVISLRITADNVTVNPVVGVNDSSDFSATVSAYVLTNASAGWKLSIKGTGTGSCTNPTYSLCKSTDTIPSDTFTPTSGTSTAGTAAWGYQASDNSTTTNLGVSYQVSAVTGSDAVINSKPAPTASEYLTGVKFGVRAAPATPSGTYTGKVTLTAVTQTT